mgnify:FL=1|jgi:hypothetical protein|tara:strand:- start:179 stop:352 length:174 start_codon:yes stop_codon:yes gene_type:complete
MSDLWSDMSKLNSMYEELCWGNEDILEFVADFENNQVIIRNKTMDLNKTFNLKTDKL